VKRREYKGSRQGRNTCKTPKQIGREILPGTGRGETKKEKEEFGIGKRKKSEKKKTGKG
jgi:hypothetical protein